MKSPYRRNREILAARERARVAQAAFDSRHGVPNGLSLEEMRSPTSMGDLVIAAEKYYNQPAPRKHVPRGQDMGYGKKKTPFEFGRQFGERAALGRSFVGAANRGPKMGGFIFGLGRSLSRRFDLVDQLRTAVEITQWFSVTPAVPGEQGIVVGGGFSPANAVCAGSRMPTSVYHTVNTVNPLCVTNQASGGVGLGVPIPASVTGLYFMEYQRQSPDDQPRYRHYQTWKRPTPGVITQAEWGYTTPPVPGVWVAPDERPYGEPMVFAPPFSYPQAVFDAAQQTEEYSGPSPGPRPVPWWVPMPLNSTQVITQTQTQTQTETRPNPPVPTRPVTPTRPVSRPPRKGTKETKWSTNTLMARLGRLALMVTEANDAIDAIAKAIPKDKLKACKKKARQRYERNLRAAEHWGYAKGAYWGTTSKRMAPQETLQCIYDNFDSIDVGEAFYQLLKNQIEDMWLGFQYGAMDVSIRRTGREVLTSPYEAVSMQDSIGGLPPDASTFWQEVEEYLTWLERKIDGFS